MRSLPTLERAKTFSCTRVLVVDTHDSTLAHEVEGAMPGAKVEPASGLEARIGDGDLDLVIAAMRAEYPKLAHHFITLPVCTDELLRVLKATRRNRST